MSDSKARSIPPRPGDCTLKLGTLTLDVPFFQAPLSGYSDHAMRKLARKFGCPFTLADVMLAKSAAEPRVLRKPCFRPVADEHPVGAQILGRTPATMAKAARDLVAAGYDLIDLNFACPAPKVLKRGRGGALLNEPDTAIDILRAVRDAVECPLIMKLRIGVNRKPESQANFWQIIERSIQHRIDALVIHGRTVSERYRGTANWEILAQIKSRFPETTLIGSGDIFDAQATVELIERTGLDGFIVARGAIGNPWIFRDLRALWEGRPVPPPPNLSEQKHVMLEHLDLMMAAHPQRRAVSRFRSFMVGYTKRHPNRKKVRLALMKPKTRDELIAAINQLYPDR